MEFRIEAYDALPSTMDIARIRAEDGAAEGLVIQAGAQTGGRGRHGNQWTSPPGNLYLSVLLRPQKPFAEFGQMAFVAALALGRAYGRIGVAASRVRIKWPNDILLDDRKGAGLLLEAGADGTYVVLGSGVNIVSAPEGRAALCDFLPAATAAEGAGLIPVFRDIYLEALEKYYRQWQQDGFAPIREAWLEQAAHLGEEITARLPNTRVNGIFEGIDSNGALMIREKTGITRCITSGEVHFGKDED